MSEQRTMNLPAYTRALAAAVETFDSRISEARDELAKGIMRIKEQFFEDEMTAVNAVKEASGEDYPVRRRD